MKKPSRSGASEYTEKRSRFLGAVLPVESEEEAKAFIAGIKKQYHDARHNCWCYRIEGKAERYSDDGEPQGTAGIPMLEVFKKEGVTDFVCVVTRYFGGVLLGAGGLLRAYTKAAKDALASSAPVEKLHLQELEFDCEYAELESMKAKIAEYEGTVTDTEYGERIHMKVQMPETEEFREKVLWKK